jgi:prepilin-type N-terminal cleavage/methylation domain-containing protein
MKKLNQKGFTFLEMLLVLIILAIIGFTGYYVWNSHEKTDSLLNTAQNETAAVKVTKKSNSTSSTKYFTISQWEVRAPYSGSLSLEYSLGSPSSMPATASFSSSALDSSDTMCANTKNYGGIITRYLSNDDYVTPDGQTTSQTAAAYAATLTKAEYAYVGKYYYFYEQPQAYCGSSQSSKDTQIQTESAVKSVLANLQAIPQ